MEKFTVLTSRIAALPIDNIDTDQIIPARFLKTISKDGLGDQLFFDWRYDGDGHPKPDFLLNQPQAKAAKVLLAAIISDAEVRANTHPGRCCNMASEPSSARRSPIFSRETR